MHIPDGVLSPATSLAATAAMLPIWTLAARRVRSSLGLRQVPLLSLGAAFCFTVMMFNIPALGGTTAHPVAGTLLAILLGPHAAVIGISVALGIQALFFGDGGLLAFGANCFTMAFVLPFVGYGVYRLLAHGRAGRGFGRALAGGIGAYIGLNAAAAIVALLLGIQPAWFHEPNGHALYFPFGLNITLPAMLGTHLLIAGPAEAVVTALVVQYLQTAGYALYEEKRRQGDKETRKGVEDQALMPGGKVRIANRRSQIGFLVAGLLVVVVLTPLGLLAKGDAWGEWDASGVREQIKQVQGADYVPQGIANADEHGYKGVRGLQDYAGDKGGWAYVGAGLLGVGSIALLLLLGGRLLANPALADSAAETQDDNDDRSDGMGGSEEENLSPEHPTLGRPPGVGRPLRVAEKDTAKRRTAGKDNTQHPSDLPDWLQGSAEAAPDTSGLKPNPFVERTLAGLANHARHALLTERWTRQTGYLQQIDPRAKVGSFLILIVVVAGLHRAGMLLLLYAFALGLGGLSRLPLSLLFKRVWLSVPLFVGALALPAALNVVTPGRTLLVLWSHPFVAVTEPGMLAAFVLMLRVGVGVTFAALLTLTTRWSDLLRALRILFVPRIFVVVLAMTYRYLAVLMQAADDLFVARRSRMVGRGTNVGGRRFVGAGMGALFGKTLALSEEVHGAMVSRGFNGDMRTLTRLQWRLADTVWTGAMLLAGCLCVGGEHVRVLPF